MGKIYLLHFDKEIGHGAKGRAQHYIGYTTNITKRLKYHRKGWAGSKIMAYLHNMGIGFKLVRTWNGDGNLERQLKNRHNAPKLCPICNPKVLP